jgi:hypothetical protein
MIKQAITVAQTKKTIKYNNTNMKAFTFSQLATILLVVLGLVVTVILIATQAKNIGSAFSNIGKQSTSGADAAAESTVGVGCSTIGGKCMAECTGEYEQSNSGNADCPTDKQYCCIKV